MIVWKILKLKFSHKKFVWRQDEQQRGKLGNIVTLQIILFANLFKTGQLKT